MKFQTFFVHFSILILPIVNENVIPTELQDLSDERKTIYRNLDETSLRIINQLLVRRKKDYLAEKKKHGEVCKDFVEVCKHLPTTDLTCAMDFFSKFGTVFFEKGVAYVDLEDSTDSTQSKSTKNLEWPERINQIRRTNDECWKTPEEPFPIYKRGTKWEENDNEAFRRWVKFLSIPPDEIMFTLPEKLPNYRDAVSMYHNFARQFQNKLNKYYEDLSGSVKQERYPDGKEELILTFSAVMVRNYRFACYFKYDMIDQIQNRLDQPRVENAEPRLSDIILAIKPYWFFDEEIMDFSNILLEMSGQTKAFYHFGTFENKKGQLVVIPGLHGCGTEPIPSDKIKSVLAELERKKITTTEK